MKFGTLRNADAVLASLAGSVLYGALSYAYSFFKQQPFSWQRTLGVVFFFVIFLNAYRFTIHKRKVAEFGKRKVFYLEFCLYFSLLMACSLLYLWAENERDIQEHLAIRAKVSQSLLPTISSFVRSREERAPKIVDDHYSYDSLTVNLFCVERTGVVEHILHGVPNDPSGRAAEPIRYSYSAEAPVEDISRYVSFEVLDAPDGKVLESRPPVLVSHESGMENAIILEVPGFADPFWCRRSVCWPGALYRAADAFVLDLAQFGDLRASAIEINFISTKQVSAAVHRVVPGKWWGGDVQLSLIEGVESIPVGAEHLSGVERRVALDELKVLRGWKVPISQYDKYLVVHYEPETVNLPANGRSEVDTPGGTLEK
jgi:hypothetical protein